jgi:hypothetical protein
VFPSTTVADDDVTMEEPGVIVGHPTLRAPGHVSLDEDIDTACLLLWASMVKDRTIAESARAEARQQHLDVREELLNRL